MHFEANQIVVLSEKKILLLFQGIFEMFSRHFQEVFKTISRRFQDVFKTFSNQQYLCSLCSYLSNDTSCFEICKKICNSKAFECLEFCQKLEIGSIYRAQ